MGYLAGSVLGLLVWLLTIEVAFVAFGVTGASAFQMEMRSHFFGRTLLGCLAMPALLMLSFGVIEMAGLPEHAIALAGVVIAIMSLAVGPVFCYRRPESSPGSEGDDGGGSAPEPQPSGPNTPRGGIPLPDADQARARVRDHHRPKLRPVNPPRRVPEPARRPAPTRSG